MRPYIVTFHMVMVRLQHLTFCVYYPFHRRKSNDFCLIQNCPNNWEGYKKGKLTITGKGTQRVELWLDNDESGEKATSVLKEHLTTNVIDMSPTYARHADVNDWYLANYSTI